MIRRSPAEYYIKYLVLHPDKYKTDKIREILELSQLDFLGNDYIERVRGLCTPPYPFYPFDPTHNKSMRFLMRERVHSIFFRDDLTHRAFDILDAPRVKEFVESMTLSGAPPHIVSAAVVSTKKFSCSPQVIEKYQHAFWNIELVDTTEIRALLRLRSLETSTDKDPMSAARTKAMDSASYQDSRRVAADLPNAPLVALLSQMRMGVMPSNVDLARVLDATRKAAALRTLEATLRGGLNDNESAVNYINVARMAGEMLETVVKPDEKLRSELSAIALTTEMDQVPRLQQLSQGQHTVEIGPRIENERKP